jgi:hypothetical protein
VAHEAVALADELGLTGRHVFFNEEWVPYEERANYLLEADVGVSTHLNHVETAFSFRTRVLDYLWAGLPIVTTEGDTFAELVESRGLGFTVRPGDVAGLHDALRDLLTDEALADRCRKSVADVAPELSWTRVLEPLMAFCREPRPAPDIVDALQEAGPRHPPAKWTLRRDIGLIGTYYKQGGPAEVVRRAYGRLRRKVDERQSSRRKMLTV